MGKVIGGGKAGGTAVTVRKRTLHSCSLRRVVFVGAVAGWDVVGAAAVVFFVVVLVVVKDDGTGVARRVPSGGAFAAVSATRWRARGGRGGWGSVGTATTVFATAASTASTVATASGGGEGEDLVRLVSCHQDARKSARNPLRPRNQGPGDQGTGQRSGNNAPHSAKSTDAREGRHGAGGRPTTPRPPLEGGQRWCKPQHRAATQDHRQSRPEGPDVV